MHRSIRSAAFYFRDLTVGCSVTVAVTRRNSMCSLSEFKELVNHICTRPQMYICGGTFYEVAAYIQGFASAMPDSPFAGDKRFAFNQYVTLTFGFPSKIVWPFVVKKATQTDGEAITRLHSLLIEYIEAIELNRVDQLLSKKRTEASAHSDGPQVICWRLFSRALHRGDRKAIEQLALPREGVEILWAASYPDDVIPLMDQIAESSAIPVLFVSEDGTRSRLMTPDFGEIDIESVSGTWRIDPGPIIRQRMFTKTQSQEIA